MQLLDIISTFFISNAAADTLAGTAAAPPQNGFSFFIVMGVILLLMYVAVWRPQNKRAKEQRELLSSLAKGDEVVTVGGLLGTVNKIHDNHIVLTLKENAEVVIQKSAVVSALPKGTLKSI